MRHRNSSQRLRQKPAHSRMLQRNLVTSLVLYESIRTTKKRAEVVQPILDRLIVTAKKKDRVNAIRALNAVFTHENATRKTLEVLTTRYKNRPSGFSRATPVGARIGDGAELVTLSLIDAVRPTAAKEEVKAGKKPARSGRQPAKKTAARNTVSQKNEDSSDSSESSASSESST